MGLVCGELRVEAMVLETALTWLNGRLEAAASLSPNALLVGTMVIALFAAWVRAIFRVHALVRANASFDEELSTTREALWRLATADLDSRNEPPVSNGEITSIRVCPKLLSNENIIHPRFGSRRTSVAVNTKLGKPSPGC
jgi:hypothetical protein